MNKNDSIIVRCSANYKNLVQYKAKCLGYKSVSEYVRACIIWGSEREQIIDKLNAYALEISYFCDSAKSSVERLKEDLKKIDSEI